MAAAALSFAATNANAASLTGAGGTAIDPLLSKWAAQYAKETGDDINYQAIGSDGGIVNMSPTDHLGLNLSAFHMLEIKDGDWALVPGT